jgi:cytochrome c2
VAAGDKSLYSESLRRVKGTWSDELLDEFLRHPNAVAPGTAMQFEGIANDDVRKTVIGFLKALQ